MQRQREFQEKQEAPFKPRTNAESSNMQLMKAYKEKYVTANQPTAISQVYSTGIALEQTSEVNDRNPFTAVQRLYERLEETKKKQ